MPPGGVSLLELCWAFWSISPHSQPERAGVILVLAVEPGLRAAALVARGRPVEAVVRLGLSPGSPWGLRPVRLPVPNWVMVFYCLFNSCVK